jgi:hypothetical protein
VKETDTRVENGAIELEERDRRFRPVNSPVTSQSSSQYRSSSTNPSPVYAFKGNKTVQAIDFLNSPEAQKHEDTKFNTTLSNINEATRKLKTHQEKVLKKLRTILGLSITTLGLTALSWTVYGTVFFTSLAIKAANKEQKVNIQRVWEPL